MKLNKELQNFVNKWKAKGIEVKFEKEKHKSYEEELNLLCQQKRLDGNYQTLITKTHFGFKLDPFFLSDVCGWEVEDGSVVSKDDLFIYMELIKEFTELTKDIKLEKGEKTLIPEKIF